jgi:thiamine-phosphate pyrophosphorylase
MLASMPAKFELVVISPEQYIADEANYAAQFFELGLQRYHLRKPLWSDYQLEKLLNAVPKVYHPKIVLHSHFQLSNKFGLKGIHLNEENRQHREAFINYPVVSSSFHSFAAIKTEGHFYEYVFLSPVFNSISKKDYKGGFDLKILENELIKLKNQDVSAPKIFALGGIDSENIGTTMAMGFSGAAVLGAIWNSDNPVKSFSVLQQAAQLE